VGLEKGAKIGLAAALLICLADMPYGYYQLVRFLAMIGFAYFAYSNYEKGNISMAFLCGLLALLFQPLLKISLGREIWNMVDVIVGIGILVSVFKPLDKN
jgi:hypothetical protein